MASIINRKTFYTFFSLGVIIAGTALAIQYAKGNFRVTDNGFVQGTGLLAANSFPTGAEVHIDDKLVTATDDTLYLEPGTYKVEIIKDGYAPWKKNINIEQELVTQTNAQLFPTAPSLSTLTFSGVENFQPSPNGEKIVYFSASASAEQKNGLYVLELSAGLPFGTRQPYQISTPTSQFDLGTAQLVWSPDSSQLLVLSESRTLLLDATKINNLDQLQDVGFRLKQILSEWEQEMYLRERQYIKEFPEEIVAIASSSATNIYLSPDKRRVVYTATAAITIPEGIVANPLPSTNSVVEERTLTPGAIYVYDREEDKNFKVAALAQTATVAAGKSLLSADTFNPLSTLVTASQSAFTALQASTSAQTASKFNNYHSPVFADTLQWYPDSKHLLFVQDGHIKVMEHDGGNQTTLYSGPFTRNFVYPSPNGERLIIITSFSPDSPENFYAVELK